MKRWMRKRLEREAISYPPVLTPIPRDVWPASVQGDERLEVWRSRDFLVQVFADKHCTCRLSINRTAVKYWRGDEPVMHDNINWDELQEIKRQIGRGDMWAVEIYPADKEVVNVANMRHLWCSNEPPPFAWIDNNG